MSLLLSLLAVRPFLTPLHAQNNTVPPTDTIPIAETNTPVETPTATPIFPSNGWLGEYFNNLTLSDPPVLTRLDPTIDFFWRGSAPDPTVNSDFSVRWRRAVLFEAGVYRFDLTHDDGMRLIMDGIVRFDGWEICCQTDSVEVALTAGQHLVVVEFVDKMGWAQAKVSWSMLAATATPTVTATPLFSPTPTGTATATPTPLPVTADGWRAEFFNNFSFAPPVVHQQYDAELNFEWEDRAPAPSVSPDFSARWQRLITIPNQAYYQFTLAHDDGLHVWVDDQPIYQQATDRYNDFNVAALLSAGPHTLTVELVDQGGWAMLRLNQSLMPNQLRLLDPLRLSSTVVKVGDPVTATYRLQNVGSNALTLPLLSLWIHPIDANDEFYAQPMENLSLPVDGIVQYQTRLTPDYANQFSLRPALPTINHDLPAIESGPAVTLTVTSAGEVCLDPAEPNNSAPSAQQIRLNQSYPYFFCERADEDWLYFDANSEGNYTIETAALSMSNDTVLELYAAEANAPQLLASNDDFAGSRASQISQFLQTGRYFVRVLPKNQAIFGAKVSYSLLVSSLSVSPPTVSPTLLPSPTTQATETATATPVKTATPLPSHTPTVTASPLPTAIYTSTVTPIPTTIEVESGRVTYLPLVKR